MRLYVSHTKMYNFYRFKMKSYEIGLVYIIFLSAFHHTHLSTDDDKPKNKHDLAVYISSDFLFVENIVGY